MTTTLRVEGMSCQNCARHVREALESVDGVRSVTINLEQGQAQVKWSNDSGAQENLLRASAEAGYPAEVVPEKEDHHHHCEEESGSQRWKWEVILGLAITVPLMIAEWGFSLHRYDWFNWVSFFAAIPVQFGVGLRFYRGAWQQAKMGQSNMDTLVALGSTAAFGLSVYGLIFPHHLHHLYFVEAAAIISLISVGHWIEARVSGKASQAVRNLMNLAPLQARLRVNGTEQIVEVSRLKVGDVIELRPGDRIPTDGAVTEGSAQVDESMLTGESVPREKKEGSQVYAGTINHDGSLLVRVTACGEETALAHIVEIIERAQNSRAQIQRLADRVSSIFVPVVMVIAVAVLLGLGWSGQENWETASIRAVSILIVACPCAMGIATPIALMAGANRAARSGILIRDALALEKCGNLTAVVFDKTGTLTEGKPAVKEVCLEEKNESLVGELTLALAGPSRHPFSRALADHFKGSAKEAIEGWREERGSGVCAARQGRVLRLGSLVWLRQQGVNLPDSEIRSDTVLGLAEDNRLLARFVLADPPKSASAEVMSQIKSHGVSVYLVSGDSQGPTEAIAQMVGIPAANVFSGIRPEQKAEWIGRLQEHGERVAFVGDGINDGPALAQADLGVAVMRASDVAREAADIILLKNDIEAVPEALALSLQTLRTIRQNLFWAFFYNAAAIPFAAGGLISPIACAAAMGMSDLFVVGNALRLLRWRRS